MTEMFFDLCLPWRLLPLRERSEGNKKRTCFKRNKLFSWSECGDLNSGPLGPEPSALPSALHPVLFYSCAIILSEKGIVKNR